MIRTLITAAVAAAALSGNAFADDTLTVEIPSWKLNTLEGTQSVYAELEAKAHNFCFNGRLTLTQRNIARECEADVLDQLVLSAKRPQLSFLHGEEIRMAGL
ncbi:UrcA family protein [Parvularcula maris]|uniref:UrcA family protein n=1 Tax=Parvularcula maris TaxID=2965077 RepID=A0A9X2RK04_9PROT|nr:UrcA family protein [Parvularcula maris]MCQ8185132.1 UrcA family protein [Parvularcula maris]